MASVDYNSDLNGARTNAEQSETGGDFRVSFVSLVPRRKLAPPSAKPNPLDRLYGPGKVNGPYRAHLSRDENLWHVFWNGWDDEPLLRLDTEEEAIRAVRELGDHWAATAGRKVYFIGAANKVGELVKIGVAYEPQKRLANLQTAWPFELRILATVQGDVELEKRLHRKFGRVRLRGEWFRITAALKRTIAGHAI